MIRLTTICLALLIVLRLLLLSDVARAQLILHQSKATTNQTTAAWAGYEFILSGSGVPWFTHFDYTCPPTSSHFLSTDQSQTSLVYHSPYLVLPGETVTFDFDFWLSLSQIIVPPEVILTENPIPVPYAAPIAEADGPYVFDHARLTVNLDGSGSLDPDAGAIVQHDWTVGGSHVGSGLTVPLSIGQSGLATTTDTSSVQLKVTDDEGEIGTDTATLTYCNAAPSVLNASGEHTLANPSVMDFLAEVEALDLVANATVLDFENLIWEFDLVPALSAGDIGDGFLSGVVGGPTASAINTVGGTLTDPLDFFGGTGTFTIHCNVTDRVGAVDSYVFSVDVVPEPFIPLLLSTGAVGLGLYGWRRRKQTQ